MALSKRGRSASGAGSVLLSGLFVGALVIGVGYNALAAPQPSLLGYYGATVPGAPRTVTVVPGATSATVHWVKPLSDGGAPIIGYDVTPYVGLFALPVRHFNTTVTPQVVTGLTNAKVTYFKVAAVNGVGTGPRSAASNSITIGAPTAPRAPAAAAGQSQATVHWVAPLSNNGSPITGYIVTPVLQGNGQKPRVFNSLGTTRVLGGLANGHRYTFKIAAKNANGIGIASALTGPVIVGTPAPPTGVHPVRVSSGRFKVNFSPGSSNGAPVTKYAAICTSANGGLTRGITGRLSPIDLPGLTPGRSYTCKVKATNGRGTGPLSAASPPTTA